MSNIQIESDIKDVLEQINQKLEKVSENITELKVGQAKIEGKIETVDEKLSGQIKALDTKVEQLYKRISNSELTNRGVLIGLVVVILGGAAKLFGLVGNP